MRSILPLVPSLFLVGVACQTEVPSSGREPIDPTAMTSDASVDLDGAAAPSVDGGVPAPSDAGMEPPPPPPPPPDPTSMCPRVRVTTSGVDLNVRPDPSTSMDPVGSLAPGTIVTVVSAAMGQLVDGVYTWYEVESGATHGWVSGRYAECTTEPATYGAFDGYYLPLACGSRVRISQGNNGTYSHNGSSRYAFDFSLGLNTPLHAIADGVVIGVKNDTVPGDPCYDGGGPECGPEANRVVVRHADGHASQYGHLNATRVSVGDTIRRGTVVGLSGSTGYSTGPHAHVQLQELCGSLSCQSVPLRFEDVPGDGVPDTGEYVTSMNCP